MLLAKDGIFPITKDSLGRQLGEMPASGFAFPGTIQGEGKLCGMPSLFVRLAGCNLHCRWKKAGGGFSPCDTAYAAYETRDARQASVEDVYRTLLMNRGNIRHVVITGGEPFLQAEELRELCRLLKSGESFHVTVESNATLYDEEVAQYVDFFSLSPKFPSSQGGKWVVRKEVIQQFIDCTWKRGKDFQLKFVYSCEKDIAEIKGLLARLRGWKNEDVLLMPLGGTLEEMRANVKETLEHCIREGWRYCDRLHLALFGSQAGV